MSTAKLISVMEPREERRRAALALLETRPGRCEIVLVFRRNTEGWNFVFGYRLGNLTNASFFKLKAGANTMQNLAEIVRFLRDKQMMLTTAESCTCGLMASLLGDIPGCGKALDSGFVVYSPKAKNRLLHVSFETIETFGLTSEEVATEMAIGALNASVADIAIANTGVADDNEEDAGGTQCYAYALMQGERQVSISETVQFEGDRVSIRKQAARYGLEQLPSKYEQLLRKLREHE